MSGSVAIALPAEIESRFRAMQKLKTGRRSEVHRVEDAHGRSCALKIRQIDGDPQLFRASVSECASFSHPAVTPVYDMAIEGSLCFLVAELFEEDLGERAQRDRWLSLEQAKTVLVDSAEALRAAHAQKLRHGGLRPSNLLFRAAGPKTFKLADFAPTGRTGTTPAEDIEALGKCLELAIAGSGARPKMLGNATVRDLIGDMLSRRIQSAEALLEAADNCVWFGDQRHL